MRIRAGLLRPLAFPRRDRRGFTLIELMITLTVLAVVMIVLTTVMYTAARSKTSTSNRIESAQASRVAVDMMSRDIRSAGYGADLDYAALPQPAVAYVDSLELLLNANLEPYPDSAARHVPPLAYNPAGSPRPIRLNGTTWAPPVKYGTGAELIRWTLDVNNDGVVNAGDVADANGVDAQRTPNPNDFVLLRQVYGDSTGNVAGNNGPARTERIALVRRPGAGVPPMFTVYFKGIPTPWDWAMGAVPANKLQDIERVDICAVAPSARPDWRGRYAETTIEMQVYAIRNVPNFGVKEFAVDGYVFDDLDKDNVKDAGEPGLAGVTVSLGSCMATGTNASGYFLFSATAGTYTLRHTPLQNYAVRTAPDSFVITIGPGVTRSFADTAVAGGWITATAWEDVDNDRIKDSTEPWREDESLTLQPKGTIEETDELGQVQFFAPVGSYTLTLAVPDSFICTTTNPATGVMTKDGTATHLFGLLRQDPGTIEGTVWQDKNGNGAINGGEPGVANVWVGVKQTGSAGMITYGYTASDGKFSIDVPANDPPRTVEYIIECIPPSGYYPTTSAEISGIFLQAGGKLTGNNFGINNFQKITLNSARVLSLTSGDLIEKDWTGNKTGEARQDVDLMLGADAAGSDQLSVWFNQYNNSPLFTTSRTFSRTAPNSVLCVDADSLNREAAPFNRRLDLVTGTALAGAGNFFVWFAQGTSGNEGYLPSTYSSAYRTADNGDVQAVQTGDVIGNKAIDIIVGTRSPTTGNGTIEIWQSDSAATPTFTRVQTYPPSGSLPGGKLNEVTCMQLMDLTKHGRADLVVGTRKDDYSGTLIVLNGNGGGGSAFQTDFNQSFSNGAVTSLTCADYNLDTKADIVVGLQTGSNKGEVQFWRNSSAMGGTLKFDLDITLTVPWIPISLASGDLGGASNPDIVVGYRNNTTAYTGGVLIYYMEGGTPSSSPVDPSGGTVTDMVPAVNCNDFNYGVKPSLPTPPYQTDVAAGVKSGPSTGALVIFIR
jgi:prepilin-type N-terminal cleavage/methylation domain-containing protein